jgi:hypothetical protein
MSDLPAVHDANRHTNYNLLDLQPGLSCSGTAGVPWDLSSWLSLTSNSGETMSESHAQLCSAAASTGADPDDVAMAANAISVSTLFTVFLQLLPILTTSAPAVLAVISDVIKQLKSGTFDWKAWQSLYAKDGPAVLAAFQAIAKALGVALPEPGPVVP